MTTLSCSRMTRRGCLLSQSLNRRKARAALCPKPWCSSTLYLQDGNGTFGMTVVTVASPVISYGIVTNSTNWSFLECKTDVLHDSGYNDPTFFLTASPTVLRFSNESHNWIGNGTKIFGHIIYQLQRMVDDIPNHSKRRKLAALVKHPQPSQVRLPTQTVNEYWLWDSVTIQGLQGRSTHREADAVLWHFRPRRKVGSRENSH